MELNSTLAWLVNSAAQTPSPELLLASLGSRLIEDGTPLVGGALTLASPHPLISRRTWLWRAESNAVIEALGFAAGAHSGMGADGSAGEAGRRWLAGLAAGPVHEDGVGLIADGPRLGWIGSHAFTPDEAERLREAARFAAAPLAALAARATLTAALEAYLGRRSAARVLAGPLRRGVGETIEAALLFADLRGFTSLSESAPPSVVISALDAWFDRIAGSVHAFGGEVLKFMGDGVLAIFPVLGASPRNACDAAVKAVAAARSRNGGILTRRDGGTDLLRYPSAWRCIWAKCCGATSAPPTGWISLPSAPRSIWSVGSRVYAVRSTAPSSSRAPSPPRRRPR